MPSPKLHIEPMTRQETESLVTGRPIPGPQMDPLTSARDKLRRALDSQPEQGGDRPDRTGNGPNGPGMDPQQQNQCGGSGIVMETWQHSPEVGGGNVRPCPGCSHPDCPNRQDQKGGETGCQNHGVTDCEDCFASALAPTPPPQKGEDGWPEFVYVYERGDGTFGAATYEVTRYVPATASPKPLLERLARELEKRADRNEAAAERLRRSGSAAHEQVKHAAPVRREIAQRLREEAEELPKSKLEQWCERAKAEGKFDSEYDAFLAAVSHGFSLPEEAEGLGEEGDEGAFHRAYEELDQVAARTEEALETLPAPAAVHRLSLAKERERIAASLPVESFSSGAATLPPESQEGQR